MQGGPFGGGRRCCLHLPQGLALPLVDVDNLLLDLWDEDLWLLRLLLPGEGIAGLLGLVRQLCFGLDIGDPCLGNLMLNL